MTNAPEMIAPEQPNATMSAPAPQLSKATATFTLRDMINLTSELRDLLENEIGLLKAMSIKDMRQHHEKKVRLISSLEVMKDTLHKHPELKATFNKDELSEFHGVSEAFEAVMLRHFRHLNAARTVNNLVVEAIKETVMEQKSTPSYGDTGNNRNTVSDMAISINETI